MGRFLGTLHKLADMASSSGNSASSNHHWTQILNYLEVHSIAHASKTNPKFDSPLPPFTSASRELERELLDQQGTKREDTPLRIVVRANSSVTIPSSIVAALLHLCPQAAQLSDSRDRIPLHWACRRSSDPASGAGRETDKILKMLIMCYPQGLLHRDDGGRTPLHWLFWYHAPTRSPKIVEVFCQNLPFDAFIGLKQFPDKSLPEIPSPNSDNSAKVPPNAAIVHDAKHGALPLHYAVMEHASRDCLRVLLNAYPLSKTCGDGKGRTALHWYLGAGDAILHICGEPHDPNAVPWHEQTKLQASVIHMLINSRVARSADIIKGRLPLHWACYLVARHYQVEHSHVLVNGPAMLVARTNAAASGDPNDSLFLSTKAFQVLLDHNMEALTAPDFEKRTPLHLLWDVALEQQDQEWKRLVHNRITRDYLDPCHGGSRAAQPPSDLADCDDYWPFFSPPLDVVKMLLRSEDSASNATRGGTISPTSAGDDPQRPTCAAYCEDLFGRVPLHGAMQVGAGTALIQSLIQTHPTSLLHTSWEETSQTPLHAAFLSPFTAPLLTRDQVSILLQAYLTSRHGTYVHGRLALKMEDSFGKYPLHYACQNQACFDVISLLVEKYPKVCWMGDHRGNLPLHCLLDENNFFSLQDGGDSGDTSGNRYEDSRRAGNTGMSASLATTMGWMSERETKFRQENLQVTCDKMRILLEPLLFHAEALEMPSAAHGLLPLHVAVAFDVLTYAQLQVMVETYPDACTIRTTIPGNEFTPLDLHDMRKSLVHSLPPTDGSTDSDPLLKWHAVRELLFSVYPQLPTHCRQDDLLDACVNLIRDEARGLGSVHMTEMLQRMRAPAVRPVPVDAMSDINVEIPEIEHGGRPQASKPGRSPGGNNTPKFKKKRFFGSVSAKNKPKKLHQRLLQRAKKGASPPQRQKKSIYDDDDVGGAYVVSPEASFDVDDDDLVFSDDQSGEEVGEEEEFEEGDESPDDFSDEDRRGVEFSLPEEKKEEDGQEVCLDDDGLKRADSAESPLLSDVALRLWTFFLLFHNPEAPEENYSDQVAAVLSDLDFDTVERLVSLPLPDYAKDFLTPRDCAFLDLQKQDSAGTESVLTLREMASPKCKAVIRRTYYFLGRFEWGDTTSSNSGDNSNATTILLHRSSDDATIILRATEYEFTTETFKAAPEEEPGEAEAEIWETGEAQLSEVKGVRKASFQVKTRTICIKFMKNEDAYRNEVQCRVDLGVSVGEEEEAVPTNKAENHIVPLLNHFSALGERREDRQYRRDTRDDRFKTVWILPPTDAKGNDKQQFNDGRSVSLEEYPFAVVLPFWTANDLQDHYYHHGASGIEEIRELGSQIGKSILSMHEKAVVHGTLTMRNVALLPCSDDSNLAFTRYCALTDLSCANRLQVARSYMGGVSRNGTAQFQSGVLPPEMFVRLSPGELKMYEEYWRVVKEKLGVTVDETVIRPHRDPVTGVSCVVRCHFVAPDQSTQTLPPLPYQLVPARETSDLWSFGLMVYTLCSNGRPLFPTNLRSGQLLDYGQIVSWNVDQASSLIYGHVRDPLAQDFLLRVLSSYEERSTLNMGNLLSHPFFSKKDQTSSKVQRTIDLRSSECLAHKRRTENEVVYHSEEGWLRDRTVNLSCWDFSLHSRIQFSSSELIRNLLAANSSVPRIPYAFIMLPYKLARGKTGKLTPVTKLNVEQAERMGVQLLALSKACHFASLIQQAVSAARDETHNWSSSEISAAMALSSEHFSQLEAEMTDLAAKHVEIFRDDPVAVARRLVQERIKDLMVCFRESGKLFLYLVDEFDCVPAVAAGDTLYPHEVEEAKKEEMLLTGLPFMHMTVLYARAVSGSVAGLVKLIFEGAYPHIPPSWQAASEGLDHVLDGAALSREVTILRDSLADLRQTKACQGIDDIRFIHDSALAFDVRRSFARLMCVKSSGASLWTLERGAQKLKELAQSFQFGDAVESKSAMEKQIEEQAARIAELEAALEKMKFRTDHNLAMPNGM